MFSSGLRHTPVQAAVVMILLEPVAAAVLASAILGERLGLLAIIGSAMMLVATIVLVLSPLRRTPPGLPVQPT